MPRNRSEKVPAIEGLADEVLSVLRADARYQYERGTSPRDIRESNLHRTSDQGDKIFSELSTRHKRIYNELRLDLKVSFVADYMVYLKELSAA